MKQLVLICTMVFAVLTTAFSQKTITGQIVDADTKEPLIGANVVVKGTTRGIATDDNGRFMLKVAPTDTLSVSYLGYQKQEILPSQKELKVGLETGLFLDEMVFSNYRISLKTNSQLMNECLIIDYVPHVIACGTGCVCSISHRNMSLSAENIDNKPVIKLNYWLNDYSAYKYSEHSIEGFEEKEVLYEVQRSTNDIDFKVIGNSESNGKVEVKAEKKTFRYGKWNERLDETNYTVAWANSQFYDHEYQTDCDSITYRVFAYKLHEEPIENPYDAKHPNREYLGSQEVKVANIKTNGLKINSLYAVPNALTINVNVSSPKEGDAEFVLVNMAGQVLLRQKRSLSNTKNDLNFETGDMPSGAYVLQVTQGRLADKWKFVIVK